MVKNIYKGVFEFPHRAYILCRAAHSAAQAKVVMAHAIAKQQEVDDVKVLKWLKDNEDKYIIKLEVEWTEND